MKRLPKAVREALAELGRIGGKKGGPKGDKARAQRMTSEERREAAGRFKPGGLRPSRRSG